MIWQAEAPLYRVLGGSAMEVCVALIQPHEAESGGSAVQPCLRSCRRHNRIARDYWTPSEACAARIFRLSWLRLLL